MVLANESDIILDNSNNQGDDDDVGYGNSDGEDYNNDVKTNKNFVFESVAR